MPDLSVHGKADNDEEVTEGGDDDADRHADGDEDREDHAEGRWPAGGATVLDGDSLPGTGGVAAHRAQAGVPGARHTVRGLQRAGHRVQGRHGGGHQAGGGGRGGLQEGPAYLLVPALRCRAELETLRPQLGVWRRTQPLEFPGAKH